jgi:hypothetical protein
MNVNRAISFRLRVTRPVVTCQTARRWAWGRPERPIGPGAGPVGELATGLRQLRDKAGKPSYRELSRRGSFSTTVLSEAAGDQAAAARAWREAKAILDELRHPEANLVQALLDQVHRGEER